MPPKRDKRKGGGGSAGGNNGTGGGGGGAGGGGVGRRMTRGHNASSSTGAGANGGSSASGASKRVSTTPKPGDGSGRNTNNSRGKRRMNASRTPAATVKRMTGKRVMTRSKKEKELTSFKDENGEVYKTGDFAYVDSQQPDLPHHICVIRDFKLDRKDSVVAEVKWFYRVSELPESVYHLLMQDRQNGKDAELYSHPQMRERELFMAFNIDTHSASLFRGKCKVKLLNEVSNITTYLTEENSFFYTFGYKPESRRLTLRNEDIYIPQSQQAELPECHMAPPSPSSSSSSSSPRPLSPSQRYSRPESRITNHEELVWKPHQLADDQLLMFLRAARSIALHAGVCMKGLVTDGYLAASADETTQQAFNTLHRNSHSTEKALQELVKRPTVGQLVAKRNWSKESTLLFTKGMRQFGKNFFKIQKELLPKKKIRELAEYYYHWKKTTPGLSSRNTRRQRKQTHIRLSRMMMKPRELTPEREYMDWSSCDEDEVADEEGEKGQSLYVCRQCYTTESPNWHHAGVQKAILCKSCRLYYKKYGLMKPVEVPAEAPDILYKSHYESPGNDDSGTTATGSRRKTRNSNGSRGVASRPGLRSQKIVKNDSEDEEEATDSSSEGSVEEDRVRLPPQPKQKALTTRRSILDHLDDNAKATPTNMAEANELTTPVKRLKTEEEGTESDEEGSTESTNGEGDRDSPASSSSTQKSPLATNVTTSTTTLAQKSPANVPITAHPSLEKSENSSSSTSTLLPEPSQSQLSSDPTSISLPQNFSRVSKDAESTCARTDLVYVHPPPEEKPVSIPKLHPQVVQRLTGPLPPPSHHPISTHPPPKVPIITNYAPQLPMGPGPILPFPFHYPPQVVAVSTSAPPISSHDPAHQRRAESVETAAREPKREEELVLQMRHHHHQQQQQQQMKLVQAQHPQLVAAHPMQGAVVTQAPPMSHAPPGHSIDHLTQAGKAQQQQQQPLAFTFPSPEEVALQQQQQQRLLALFQSGAAQISTEPFPGASAAAIFQPGGLFPGTAGATPLPPVAHPFTVETLSHLRPEEQAALLAAQAAQQQQAHGAMPQFLHGPILMDQLLAQQHQQQAALVVAASATGGLTATPSIAPPTPAENVAETQRNYELLLHSIHRNPIIAQSPQVKMTMEHYQRVLQEHHLQQQQRLAHEMLSQQQQHELQKHLLLARVPPGAAPPPPMAPDEGSSSRGIRTGVIVHT